MIAVYVIVILAVIVISAYAIWFYPRQIVSGDTIHALDVTTPNSDTCDYHNDVLHPCIRKYGDKYIMVQSPWYNYNDKIENPLLYISNRHDEWLNAQEVAGTPETGYNSDPNVYYEDGTIYVLWREADTQLCKKLHCAYCLVGVTTKDGKTFTEKKVFAINESSTEETIMCPILMRYKDRYRIYATWYCLEHENKHNMGIALWEGSSLNEPDFKLVKKVPVKPIYVCDKAKQWRINDRLFFIPRHHKFDLWHFDLFEYSGKLWMVAIEEMEDNVMLAYSSDWEHFEFIRKPLVNAHVMESIVGYRQHYYKPTAFVENDILHLYYTANPARNSVANKLYYTEIEMNKL